VVCPNELMLLLDDHAFYVFGKWFSWLVGWLLASFWVFVAAQLKSVLRETLSCVSG
jgi:hypothetical protein